MWKLSTELMEAKSQILEQKASGQNKIENSKNLLDDNFDLVERTTILHLTDEGILTKKMISS